MPKKPFTVKRFSEIDKYVEIEGPDYFRLLVDFDDVNHKEVRKQIKKAAAILNEHWNDDAEKVGQEKAEG